MGVVWTWASFGNKQADKPGKRQKEQAKERKKKRTTGGLGKNSQTNPARKAGKQWL